MLGMPSQPSTLPVKPPPERRELADELRARWRVAAVDQSAEEVYVNQEAEEEDRPGFRDWCESAEVVRFVPRCYERVGEGEAGRLTALMATGGPPACGE